MSFNNQGGFNKILITKTSLTQSIIDYITNRLSGEDGTTKHYFHKIMVYNWSECDIDLYESINETFSTSFTPVNYTSSNLLSSFYTNNLSLIMQILRLNFDFLYNRLIYSVDILFNDKTSFELFHVNTTMEDIVGKVVSNRFREDFELDLSNFCNDSQFMDCKIHFYKLSLLSNYKSLMLRMGRDTKILNLSNNNLSHVPQEVMNFFIKGCLLGCNISYNNIPSIAELHRMNSKLEKLWLEGNPLCEGLDAETYVKEITKKFPRLTELDGIKINNYGIIMPFHKNFIVNNNYKSKIIMEEFITLYFAHFDSNARYNVGLFYDVNTHVTVSHNFNESEKKMFPKIVSVSRYLHKPTTVERLLNDTKIYRTRDSVVKMLCELPSSRHDLNTFKVDVVNHTNNVLICIIDGIFQEQKSVRFFNFRRTVIFREERCGDARNFWITHEMITISCATKELIDDSFQYPIRHVGELTLINPNYEDKKILVTVLQHLTRLTAAEAEARLMFHGWDLRQCISEFKMQVEANQIGKDKFDTDDELSDSMSDLCDEID